jgi:uncharacterized protein YbjT (DUF2867 family)
VAATRVAVTGASGKTGRAVVAALRERGVEAVALVRDPARAPAGTPSALVDLDSGRGLDDALRGCQAVYLVVPNLHPDEPGLVARVLDAAAASGVTRVVYHSVAQPYAPDMPHHVDKARSEDIVRRSRLRWTVLQPGAYVQNFTGQLRSQPPALAVPYDVDAPFRLVDVPDVAAAAAAVLTETGHEGSTYELAGPAVTSVRDVADMAAKVLARPVPASRMTVEEWLAGPGRRLGPVSRDRLVRMFTYYDQHGLLAGSLALRTLLGRPPLTVQQALQRELDD